LKKLEKDPYEIQAVEEVFEENYEFFKDLWTTIAC